MVAAIVPVKKLSEAKMRLSGFLSPLERKKLCLAMLFDVLGNLENIDCIKEIYIVTPDKNIEAIVNAHYKNIHTIKEPAPSNLNNALHHTMSYLKNSPISDILIIPGDLPLAKAGEIERVLCQAENGAMTIVPDKTFYGTNLLFLNQPSKIQTRFGPNSFMAHITQAREKGVSYNICSTFDLLWDIDCPGDIPAIMHHGCGTRTYREIFNLGINYRVQSNNYSDISI
jgi:2-phospho-L-lactate guanylyltransferase